MLSPTGDDNCLVISVCGRVLHVLSGHVTKLKLSVVTINNCTHCVRHAKTDHTVIDLLDHPLGLVHSPCVVLSTACIVNRVVTRFVADTSNLNVLLVIALFPALIDLKMDHLSTITIVTAAVSVR